MTAPKLPGFVFVRVEVVEHAVWMCNGCGNEWTGAGPSKWKPFPCAICHPAEFNEACRTGEW